MCQHLELNKYLNGSLKSTTLIELNKYLDGFYCKIKYPFDYTVEALIAATFTAKVRWPLLGGGRYSEVYYKYEKAFGAEG